MNRPNIVYIHSHDTGRYIQPYGHAVNTPHLQTLANEGILFRRMFNAAPTCSPSRAALLTGQSPHSSGMLGLAHRGFRLHDYRQHLVHTLAEAGYQSVLAGVQHVAANPQEIGYTCILDATERSAAAVSTSAAEWLSQSPSTPFFLDVGFFETHREFPAASDNPDHIAPPAPLPDAHATRADMAAYHASAQALDAGVGRVLAALDAAGLRENTLVIYTTDHGLAFPLMKCNLTDHGMGVAFITRGPAPFDGHGTAQVCDALLSHIDVFPTLCEWLELPRPAWLQGNSFLSVLTGETTEVNDAIYGEVTYHAAYEPQRAIRTARYKYIRRYGERTTPILPNCDDSPSKDLLLEHGWRNRPVAREALFDLIYDPNEASNLIDAPDYVDVREEMRTRLNRWMLDTDDPLLMGPVPAPAGAQVNDPAGLSPREAPAVIT